MKRDRPAVEEPPGPSGGVFLYLSALACSLKFDLFNVMLLYVSMYKLGFYFSFTDIDSALEGTSTGRTN